MQRIISLMIAGFYVVWTYLTWGGEKAFLTGIIVIWPVALIWFGDYFAHYRGWAGWILIRRESPGLLIRGMGWFLLLLLIPIYLIRLSYQ